MVSAALIGLHPAAYHYVLAAHAADYTPGAGERLIYQTARHAAKGGSRKLVLGGGVTAAADDGLLRFKARFTRELVTFFIGKMVHDKPRFAELCNRAITARPDLANSSYFPEASAGSAMKPKEQLQTIDRDEIPLIFAPIRSYYTDRIIGNGPTPAGVDWPDAKRQITRFGELARLFPRGGAPFSVLDYGCGYGHSVPISRPKGSQSSIQASISRTDDCDGRQIRS